MARWTATLAMALLFAAACGDDAKKHRTPCDTDDQCSGGVCYSNQCYEACTEQHDCAADEFCVFTDTTSHQAAICVVAADHAGCTTDVDCADLAKGACEKVTCDPAHEVCQVGAVVGCSGGAPQPQFGAWRPMPTEGAPSARNYVGGAWTGSRFCLWGGYNGSSLGDGACYDPTADAWKALPTDGAPEARCLMPEAWAGDRFCTWAGYGAGSSGFCWIEATNAWEPMAEAGAPSTPRQNHGAAWTGTELCFYGGRSAAGGTDLPDGGCYDPVAKTWRLVPSENGPAGATNPSVMWLLDRLCVWGGWNAAGFQANGACWTPGADSWAPVATPPDGSLAPFVDGHPAGDRFCAWGGSTADSATFFDTGACYVPSTDSWHVLPTVDAPATRGSGYASAWTGDWWCLYGGTVADETPVAGGACYSPALGRWFPMPDAGAIATGSEASAFWTGSEFCVWGGRVNGQNQAAGACLPITAVP